MAGEMEKIFTCGECGHRYTPIDGIYDENKEYKFVTRCPNCNVMKFKIISKRVYDKL